MSEVNNFPRWAVAVFAHNEADSIVQCLDSILAGTTQPDRLRAYVLNNGSSDDTSFVVNTYAARHPWVELVEIARGDKANAWNHFVHEVSPSAEMYCFVDGDVTVETNAFDHLREALNNHPEAHIATGVPRSGRHVREQHERLAQDRGVQGNLYAVRPDFLNRIRKLKLRMPFGFIREDGLVGAFAMFNLDPLNNKWNKKRVAVATDAGFFFPSLKWWRWADVHLYWRRRIRYSIGHFENQMLSDLLWLKGIQAMPVDVLALYQLTPLPSLKWRGSDTFFDLIAHHRIKARMRRKEN